VGVPVSLPVPGLVGAAMVLPVSALDDHRLQHDVLHRPVVVPGLRPADLVRKPKGSKVTNLALVTGIAAHDLYHAGQIQLIKRLIPRRLPR